MIKTLQKKFIFTAMTAITILIVVILGVVNILNYVRIKEENAHMLDMLVQNEGMPSFNNLENGMNVPDDIHQPPNKPQDDIKDKEPKMDFFGNHITEDSAMSARFFVVKMSYGNEIVYVDVNHISSVTEKEAEKYAKDIINTGKKSGVEDGFLYRVEESKDGQGRTIVCLYNSGQNRNILWVLMVSGGIGITSWLLMLIIVFLLSKRAIKPIAENIDKQKTFVTDAGHEIKTPLAIILANIDAMELHNGENKWSKNIRNQTDRLSGLMKNLLALSRMEEGGIKADVEINLSQIVEETVDCFVESAEKKEIKLCKDIDSDVKYIIAENHIQELVSVLMDNAIKYSPNEKKINILLKQKGKNIRLSISNHCKEISKEELGKLFDRFYRTDSARTYQNGGYGIGLSVARAIVENYKGNIDAKYEEGLISFEVTL